jgi:hypothetical protein
MILVASGRSQMRIWGLLGAKAFPRRRLREKEPGGGSVEGYTKAGSQWRDA